MFIPPPPPPTTTTTTTTNTLQAQGRFDVTLHFNIASPLTHRGRFHLVTHPPTLLSRCRWPHAGTINTPMNVNFMEAKDEATSRSPIVRWGTPDEVASAVVFLSGDQASFITGQSLTVDGGLLAKGVWADNEKPGLND
jgi:hypothetical protein